MFSRILIKLIDQAIVPAVLLLSARIISVVLISRYLGVEFSLSSSGFSFTNPEEYIQVNSYSILSMVLILSLGLGYILIKSYVFHDTHIPPGTTAKVFSYNLSSLIQDSYNLYTQGAIWLSYTYLLTIVTGIMAGFGFLYKWVFNLTLILTVIVTLLFVLDVENELKISNKRDPDFDIDWSDELEPEGNI